MAPDVAEKSPLKPLMGVAILVRQRSQGLVIRQLAIQLSVQISPANKDNRAHKRQRYGEPLRAGHRKARTLVLDKAAEAMPCLRSRLPVTLSGANRMLEHS